MKNMQNLEKSKFKIISLIFISNLALYLLVNKEPEVIYQNCYKNNSTRTGYIRIRIKALLKTTYEPGQPILISDSHQKTISKNVYIVEEIPKTENLAMEEYSNYIIECPEEAFESLSQDKVYSIFPNNIKIKSNHRGQNEITF